MANIIQKRSYRRLRIEAAARLAAFRAIANAIPFPEPSAKNPYRCP